MIKHIVFDFGGVILNLDGVHTGYPNDLAHIFDMPLRETKKIWNEQKTLVITGKETPLEFLKRIKSELDLTFNVEEGIAFWKKQNKISKNRIDWELVNMLIKLKDKYQIHMLTDQIKLDNGSSLWINDIDKHFSTILRSYEQGHRKPFSESYQNLLKKIGASDEPETVLFIDDSQINIEAANDIGINGLLYIFKNHGILKKFLNNQIPILKNKM